MLAAAKRIRADKVLLEDAARTLRHRITQDAYAGLRDPESGYALAGLLDEAALHYIDPPSGLVPQALNARTADHATAANRATGAARDPR